MSIVEGNGKYRWVDGEYIEGMEDEYEILVDPNGNEIEVEERRSGRTNSGILQELNRLYAKIEESERYWENYKFR